MFLLGEVPLYFSLDGMAGVATTESGGVTGRQLVLNSIQIPESFFLSLKVTGSHSISFPDSFV